jgi:hypothetical protein
MRIPAARRQVGEGRQPCHQPEESALSTSASLHAPFLKKMKKMFNERRQAAGSLREKHFLKKGCL